MNANLTVASFTNANLTNANFTGASHTPGTTTTVTGAIWNNTTCWDGRNSAGTDTSICLGHGF